MKSRGIENASIVGLSNGGRIISKIADIEPELIKDLFYIASSGFYAYEEVNDKGSISRRDRQYDFKIS